MPEITNEKMSLRDSYGKALVELGRANRNVVALDADLSGSTRTSMFAREFPERFFDMGISEQDMVGTAAGFAAGGKIPFASTFAIFASGRAWEQIRQSVCYPKANVKIVASHGGITVGEDGPSHQACEDIALMRAIPNMTVIVPSDAHETAGAVRTIAEYGGPVYMRLPRDKFPLIFDSSKEFRIGKADMLGKGRDAFIIACGIMTHMAVEAAVSLKKEGLSVGVINMSSIKPIDVEILLKAARDSGALVTAEEHSIIGGLGSAVSEVTSENHPVPVVRVGVKDTFASSGDSRELLDVYGLTPRSLMSAVRKAVSLKTKC